MGNEQCNQCKDSTIQSFAYGTHEILQQNNHYYAVVEKKVEKDLQLQIKVAKQLQMRKNINNLHITKLHKYKIVQQAYGFKTIMYYEYVPKTLRDRLQQLKSKGQQFTERELFAIIYGVEQGLQILDEHKINHNCINLDTILVRNNIYKITDVSSTTYITAYDLAAKGNREQFLSENLLDKLIHQSLHPIYSYRDDLFSLGMICLALGTRRTVKDYYDFNAQGSYQSLNFKAVDKSLREMQRKYSSRLVKKIKDLIYNKEPTQSDIVEKSTKQNNLISTLHELDEEINKILIKTTSLNSTTVISPQKSYGLLFM